MANDGTVRIGTLLDDTGFKSGLKKLGSVAKSALTGTTAVIGAASAAIGVLSAKALDAYSSYEQLTGGVETLFKESADIVMEYADNAYKTAGMSANAYMETVTSFSASLLQGLGGDTAAAAEVANQAITDMSDNANKMGTSMEMIQNAYQGFAKQNYTMLDNLKLGYGGTQAEMARLINDSGVLGDTMEVTADTVNSVSFDKIIEAIHVIQTEMGITGTTAKEASTTIEGSANSMKAAFENLLTGIADDNADLDTLIDNFVSSAETAASNILPRLTQILSGMGEVVQELAPIIAEQLPEIIESVVPSLISAGAQLIVGLAQGLITALPSLISSIPQIVQSIVASLNDSASEIMSAGSQLLSMFANGIMSGLPVLAGTAVSIMSSLGTYLSENLPELIQRGLDAVVVLTGSIRDNAGLIVDGALSLAKSLAQGLVDSIPTIIQNIPIIVSNIANAINDNAPKVFATAVEIIGTLVSGLISAIPTIIQNLPQIINAIVNAFLAFNWLNLGKTIITGLGNGLKAMGSFIKDIAGQIGTALKNGISNLRSEMITIGKNIVQGLWNGITGMASWIKEKVTGFVGGIVGAVKGVLGIHSPSTVFRDQVGKNIGLGIAEGLEDSEDDAVQAANDLAKSVYEQSKEWIDKQTKYQDYSLKEQLEVWEAIQDQFISESQQYADAEEKIFDLRTQIQDEYYSKVKEITQNISDLQEEYQDELADRTQDIFDTFGIFDEIPERQEVSGEQLISNLENQVALMEEFYSKLDELSARGVNTGIVESIKDMGPDAVSELDALLVLEDEKLSEFSGLYEEKQRLANEQAIKELEPLKEETLAQISENLDDLSALYEENAPYIGETFSESLAKSIEDGQEIVSSAAAAVAKNAVLSAQEEMTKIIPYASAAVSAANYAMSPSNVSATRFSTETAISNAAGLMAMAANLGGSREVVFQVNGTEFARAIIPDLRAVESQSPAIVSD